MPNKNKKTSNKKVVKKKTKAAVKKTVKKKTVKKTDQEATKKITQRPATKRKTRPVLVCVYGKDCFWVNQGPILQDLIQLRDTLKNMSDVTFKHHVSKNHNDFADWVQFVLLDKSCANALRKSTRPKTAQSVLIKRLKYYCS